MDLSSHYAYRERVSNALARCPFIKETDHYSVAVYPSESNWTKFQFALEVSFFDSSRLILQEIFCSEARSSWKQQPKIQKKISYHYMDSGNKLIFRLDSHHLPVDLNMPLHLDIPGRRNIHDGDPLLCGACISNADFFFAYDWACMRMSGQALPWEGLNAEA